MLDKNIRRYVRKNVNKNIKKYIRKKYQTYLLKKDIKKYIQKDIRKNISIEQYLLDSRDLDIWNLMYSPLFWRNQKFLYF